MSKTYKAEDIAEYFLSLPEPDYNDISNLKLQKLCYYAQGLTFCLRNGTPLFKEDIVAWDHGPVVPELYQKYKSYGSSPIEPNKKFNAAIINDEDKEVLNEIYDQYAQFSPSRLRNMTHDEKPWKVAYFRAEKTIGLMELFDFFCPQIDDNYRGTVYNGSQI